MEFVTGKRRIAANANNTTLLQFNITNLTSDPLTMMHPASYLRDQWGKDSLSYYGLQTWLFPYRGEQIPCLRGMLGQYIFAIPSRQAIVVRLGRKRHDVYCGPFTVDMTRYLDIAMKILDADSPLHHKETTNTTFCRM